MKKREAGRLITHILTILLSLALLLSGCSGGASVPASEDAQGGGEAGVSEDAQSGEEAGASEDTQSGEEDGASDSPVKDYKEDGVDYSKALAKRSQSSEDSDPEILLSDPGREPSQKDCTVMIYMVGSDLESRQGSATMDQEEIDAADLSFENCNVIVYTGGSARWVGDVPCDRNSVLDMSLRGDDRIVAGTKANANMGLPETLSAFLNFCDEYYPAEHNVLILWDHGGGPLFGYGVDELYDADSLMLTEMRSAMDASPFSGDRKLDVVGFDACLMGSLESMTIWKDYAEYYVGSEELEPGAGWNYEFLKALEEPFDAKNLTSRIVSTFESYYSNRKSASYNPDLTLSCVDLSRIDDVNAAMDALADRMQDDAEGGEYVSVVRGRSESKSFGMTQNSGGEVSFYYDLVDLGDLADNLSSLYPEETALLRQSIESAVADMYANVEGANGMTLYYPYKNKGQFEEMNAYYSELGGTRGFASFLTKSGKQWMKGKSRNWVLGEPADSGSEYTLQLTEDELSYMTEASYTILMYSEIVGSYVPYMENCKLVPDKEGVLHVSKNLQLAAMQNGYGSKIIRAKEVASDRKRTVYTTQGVAFKSDLLYQNHILDLETAYATIQFSRNRKSGEIEILNVTLDDGLSGVSGGKSTIDITDWEAVDCYAGTDVFIPARDGTGRMLPFREWLSTGATSWNTYVVDNKVGIELLDTEQLDPTLELVCQIEIRDANGEKYASELFPITTSKEKVVETETEGGTLQFVLYEDHAELSAYNGRDEKITVPETVEGVPVTVICDGAFSWYSVFDSQGYDPVKEVVLSDSVTELGEGAFANCFDLEKIRIPSGLKKIGNEAFANCYALGQVELPDSVESIGKTAFAYCSSLTEFRLPKGLQSIGTAVFMNCSGLTEFTGSAEKAVSIVDGALYTTDGSELLAYPGAAGGRFVVKEGTKKICYGTFAGASLKEVILPESLEEIGNYAFYDCNALQAPVFPEGLRKVGVHAFDVQKWGIDMDEIPTETEVVRIPDSLESIGVHAFDKFLNVRFEVGAENRHYSAVDGALMNKAGDTAHQLSISPDGTAVFPEGTITFTEEVLDAFDSAGYGDALQGGVRNIYLPESMTKFPDEIEGYLNMDEHALYHCPSGSKAEQFAIRCGLTYTNEMGRVEDTVEVSTDRGTLYFDLYSDHAVLKGYSGEDEVVEIPQEVSGKPVTAVGNGTEPICTTYSILEDTGRVDPNLTRLVIPEGVTTINAEALSDIQYGTEVVLPSTIRRLGRKAIHETAVVKDLPEALEILEGECIGDIDGKPFVITPRITYIDPNAFTRAGLTAFEQSGENEYYSVKDGVLFNADGTELVKYPNLRTDEEYAIPEGTETVGGYAFIMNNNLQKVILPATLKVIDEYAFSDCSALTGIDYAEDMELEMIGLSAFGYCSSLTEIALPPVREIGDHAFNGCRTLRTVHFSEGTRSIGYSAFGYTAVASPAFPESLVKIGSNAFQDGTGGELREGSPKSIRIPAHVTEIGYNAFGSIGNTEFEVDPQNTAFSFADGLLMDKDKNAVISCPSGCEGRVVVPDGATAILDNCFYSASKVTDIEIPDSVIYIGSVNFNPIWNANEGYGDELKYAVTIHCSKGSYAERFAESRGIPCEAK